MENNNVEKDLETLEKVFDELGEFIVKVCDNYDKRLKKIEEIVKK